ncbi:Arylsulfatase precursor [Pseudobythopirellula maris]|uniref:Arylsulfatase n=1 Tax=Pseudobythopirellula maris TaxID=2527991 RepID=A0A5C5ZNZ5_9BACT|nr:arylsulfatase [Pseudobythopirellula maris]TWT88815.1 Arylsulfatase precursor [Pseudobythopirellula maris]
MPFSQRVAFFLLMLAVLTPCGAVCGQSMRPNVLFVLADDLGYGDLSCYGQRLWETPHIDAAARKGVRFTQHYAGSTVCAPSRAVLMTGLHTGHCPVRGNRNASPTSNWPLPSGAVTLAGKLQEVGYRTALIGKWGLGDQHTTGDPLRQGFDHFFGYYHQNHAHNYWPEFLWRNGDRVPLSNTVPEPTPSGGGVATERGEYTHDLFVDEALRWIGEDAHGRPFMLLLTLTIPHANNEAGDEGQEVPDLGPYADKPWPPAERATAAMIARMDRDFGRLRARLAELGLAENTLVVFASDNGPHAEGGRDPRFSDSSGGLRGIKRDLYEGGIRVPAIACWPGVIGAGGVSESPSAFEDWLPTLAELAGAEPLSGIDGVSLAPTLMGEGEQAPREVLYWEFHEGVGARAVRVGDLKLIERGVATDDPEPVELYDLARDPGENRDLASERPDTVRRLAAVMRASREPSADFSLPIDEQSPTDGPSPAGNANAR